MPTYKTGNMFEHLAVYDHIFVTGNSFIKKDGAVVMGRGAALQLKTLFPTLPFILGYKIFELSGHLGEYNLVYAHNHALRKYVGLLQVKYHFKDIADYNLMRRSCNILHERTTVWKNSIICVNYPGIGEGRLPKKEVEHIVELLPTNIHIWTLE